jgi:beta-xylosidase
MSQPWNFQYIDLRPVPERLVDGALIAEQLRKLARELERATEWQQVYEIAGVMRKVAEQAKTDA